MILSNYNFNYYSDKEAFLRENKDILEQINGIKIQEVYALWDNIDSSWFLDAPMLIQFEAGILSIKVKSEKDIAIGWNDIDLNSKPVWLPKDEIPGWKEDLEWKRYSKVEGAIGRRILTSMTIKEEITNNLIGIQFLTEQDGLLKFIDSGDEINGRFVNFKYEFFRELMNKSFEKNIMEDFKDDKETFASNVLWSCYWYPLANIKKNISTYFDKSENWDNSVRIKQLINIFKELCIQDVIVVPELEPVYVTKDICKLISEKDTEDDTYILPYLSECFFFDSTKKWMIYVSHESTITFAGIELLNKLKNVIGDFCSYIEE
ncbi:MAG: hypothetical protein ACI33J_05470 [Clostridium sp.]